MGKMKQKTEDKHLTFDIVGSGQMQINDNAGAKCGGVKGFHLTQKLPGETRFIGGVLSREDAETLAVHILTVLKSKHLNLKDNR